MPRIIPTNLTLFSALHIHFKLSLFYKAPPKGTGSFGHSTRRTISLYVGVITLIVCIRMPVFGHLYGVLFEVVRSNGGVCHGPFEGWRTPWIVGCLWTPEALDPVDKAKQDSYSEYYRTNSLESASS
jgi:hypothetical protein